MRNDNKYNNRRICKSRGSEISTLIYTSASVATFENKKQTVYWLAQGPTHSKTHNRAKHIPFDKGIEECGGANGGHRLHERRGKSK